MKSRRQTRPQTDRLLAAADCCCCDRDFSDSGIGELRVFPIVGSVLAEAMADEDEVERYKRLYEEQKARVKDLERTNSQLKVFSRPNDFSSVLQRGKAGALLRVGSP